LITGALLRGHTLVAHLLRQPWQRSLHAIVDVDRGLIGIGADVEVDADPHRTGIRVAGTHVDHVLDAVDFLLQRCGDRGGDHLGAGARIRRFDHHFRRHDFRILLD